MHLIYRRQILLKEMPRPRPSTNAPIGNQAKQSKPTGIIFALGGTLKDKVPPKSNPNPKINSGNRPALNIQKIPSPVPQQEPNPIQVVPIANAVKPVITAPAEPVVLKQQPTATE